MIYHSVYLLEPNSTYQCMYAKLRYLLAYESATWGAWTEKWLMNRFLLDTQRKAINFSAPFSMNTHIWTHLTSRGVRQINISYSVTAWASISTYMAALHSNVTFLVQFVAADWYWWRFFSVMSHSLLRLSQIYHHMASLHVPLQGNSGSIRLISLSTCMHNACERRSAVASATRRTV